MYKFEKAIEFANNIYNEKNDNVF